MKGFARALLGSCIPSVDAGAVYSRHFMLLLKTQSDMHETVTGTQQGTLL